MGIAVVIPLFDGAPFLRQALESVFTQTRLADEVIVVDDGSTDGGEGARIAGYFPIRLLQKANGGQSSARNFGVAHSDAELVALLDQDDVWYPEHLASLEAAIARDANLGFAYGNADKIDIDGALIERAYHNRRRTGGHPKTTAFHYAGEDMHILPSTTLMRRSAFDAVGGFDPQLSGCEDDDLFGRMLRAGYGNLYLADPTTAWRIHPGSSGHSPRFLDSRAIYAQKLIATHERGTPADRELIASVIVPRFVDTFLIDLRNAARARDNSGLHRAQDRYAFLRPHMQKWQRVLLSPAFRDWRTALALRPIVKAAIRRRLFAL